MASNSTGVDSVAGALDMAPSYRARLRGISLRPGPRGRISSRPPFGRGAGGGGWGSWTAAPRPKVGREEIRPPRPCPSILGDVEEPLGGRGSCLGAAGDETLCPAQGRRACGGG